MAEKIKRGRGRPPADLDASLRIFEIAVASGETITDALGKAKIKSATYYEYLTKHPEYAEKVRGLRRSILEVADQALSKQLQAEPKDPAHRKEIIDIAFKIREQERNRQPLLPGPNAPGQLQGPQQININLGNQMLSPDQLNDLTDDELVAVHSKEKTLAQVLDERKIKPKPSAS